MKTWIFEIAGNHASIYVWSALSGAVLYRKIQGRRRPREAPAAVHERFLRYVAEEVSIAGAPGSGGHCQLRGNRHDVERVRSLLRRIG